MAPTVVGFDGYTGELIIVTEVRVEGVVLVPPRLLVVVVELEGSGGVDIEEVGNGADVGRLHVVVVGAREQRFKS